MEPVKNSEPGNGIVKWGILSCGKIAADFVEALSVVPGGKVVAVAARRENAAKIFADKFHIKRFYGSYEELVNDPEVEVIYVSTIHPLHKENVMLCLEHGKHVLCEKPFTINALELEEIIEYSRKRKLLLMEGMWTRHFPAVKKLMELLAEGAIGKVLLFQASFGFKDNGTPRLQRRLLGGGSLMDIGVYPTSFASMIFGGQYPSRIVSLANISSEEQIDQQISVTLGYGENQMATFLCTMLASAPNEASIIGENGIIKIHKPFWCPTEITIQRNDSSKLELTFPLPEEDRRNFNFVNSVGLRYEIEYVHSLLWEGKLESDVETLDESLTIMKIMDEIRKQIHLTYPSEQHERH